MIAFGAQIYLQYQSYHDMVSSKYYRTQATVIQQYAKTSKHHKRYYVLKCQSKEGFRFITTNYEDIKDLSEREIEIGLITDKVTFFDFLKGFYAPSFEIGLLAYHDSFKENLQEMITKQHSDEEMQELFAALFLATPISKGLRQKVSKLGISHLIAISGYHLSFIFGLLYLLLSRPYRLLQERYFPYRNRYFDLSMGILIFLFGYMYLLDFTPSLIRSFVMMAFAFFLFHRHMKILSFEVLAVAVLVILAIKPTLLFSIGFWFSVSGVFYIYLYLHYFKEQHKWLLLGLINLWVFVCMIPIVHTIFPIFSWAQLTSPLISILFAIFYPLEMLLHLIGEGDLLDSWLKLYLDSSSEIIALKTPLWYLALYILTSLLAIFERRFLFVFAAILLLFVFVVKVV